MYNLPKIWLNIGIFRQWVLFGSYTWVGRYLCRYSIYNQLLSDYCNLNPLDRTVDLYIPTTVITRAK